MFTPVERIRAPHVSAGEASGQVKFSKRRGYPGCPRFRESATTSPNLVKAINKRNSAQKWKLQEVKKQEARSQEARSQDARCKMQQARSNKQEARCKMQEAKMQEARSQDARSKKPRCKMQEAKMQGARCKMQEARSQEAAETLDENHTL
ncbi:MAG TPA: hypothetical protein VFL34_03060 [Candidatus Sulfotelmatobacter sp.]|nr:hypothetical protein [Candidatus Sulfotelmatobacter sp.]